MLESQDSRIKRNFSTQLTNRNESVHMVMKCFMQL